MAKLQELNPEDFNMEIYQDLGLDEKGVRYALFVCSECEVIHKRIVKQIKFHKSRTCSKCSAGVRSELEIAQVVGASSEEYRALKYVLKSIIRRCYNKADKNYKNYGAIGVTVCNEWLENPDSFIKWAVGNGYSPELSLDKDKNSHDLQLKHKIYSPETCHFADKTIQARYRIRIPSRRGVGIEKQGLKYRARITIDKKKIPIGTYETLELAIQGRNSYILNNNLDFPLEQESIN